MTLRKGLLMSLLLAAGLLWAVTHPGGEGATSNPDHRPKKVLPREIVVRDLKRLSAVSGEQGSWAVLSAAELQKLPPAPPTAEQSAPPPQQAGAAEPPRTPFGDPIPFVLRRPEGAPVDKERLDAAIAALNGLTYQSEIPAAQAEEELESFALQPPKLVLTAEDSLGKIVLSFGDRHPLSGRRYIMREDTGTVLIAEDTAFNILNVPADELRDKRPLRFDPARVRAATISLRNGQTIVVQWIADGLWSLTHEGARREADTEAVLEMLRAIGEVRVRRFVDETPETLGFFGLTVPRAVIGLFLDSSPLAADGAAAPGDSAVEGKRIVLQVGEGVGSNLVPMAEPVAQSSGEAVTEPIPPDSSPKLSGYIKVRGIPTIYELMKSAPAQLFQGPEQYWHRRPCDQLGTPPLSKVVLRAGTAALSAEASGSGWKGEGKELGEPVAAELAGLVGELRDLKVISYLQPGEVRPEMGLDGPGAEIELWPTAAPGGPGAAVPYKIRVGAEVARGVRAGAQGKKAPGTAKRGPVPRYLSIAVPPLPNRPPRTAAEGNVAIVSGESWSALEQRLHALLGTSGTAAPAEDGAPRGGAPAGEGAAAPSAPAAPALQ